jgi:membrane associated rhomboid family serine protease
MGIHDRDYYRESTRRYFDPWGREAVTVWLIIVTCVVFLLDLLSQGLVRDATIYDYAAVRRGEVWRLVTPLFLHAGLFHLACNMLVLYWAGSAVEDLYGSREYLLYYLGAGLFAGAAEFALHLSGAVPPHRGLGASGAVTAVLVLFALHYPHHKVNFYLLISMPVWLLVVIYVAIDVLGALGAGQEGIGYLAHLGGALFAVVYYQTGWRFVSLLPARRTERRAATPRLRVVPAEPEPVMKSTEPVAATADSPHRPAAPADEQLEARVDRILEKVSKHGQESLTPEERELLFQASERYKKRRK